MSKQNRNKSTIPSQDESDLIFFFGRGACVFERSTCGPMLDALERDSCTSVSCKRCKGQGIIGLDDWSDPENGEWCRSCGGTGTLPVSSKRSKHSITVKPKKQSNYTSGKTAGDSVVTRFAGVSRRISRMFEIAPESVQVLAAFYGNAGTGWAQTEGYGRLFPVLSLTKAGQTLLKKATGKVLFQDDQREGLPKDAHQLLGDLDRVQKELPEAGRGKLFSDAYLQADRLMKQAALDWASAEVVDKL